MIEPMKLIRVQVDFTPETFRFFEALAEKTNCRTKAELMRHALVTYNSLVDEVRAGRVIQVVAEDGEVARIILPSVVGSATPPTERGPAR